MIIALIAAVGRNGVIGDGFSMPWKLSADLKRFKALTLGKALVMGRKTFQSIGVALPGRHTIVISRDPSFDAPGIEVANGFDLALENAAMYGDEVMVAGGGEIYAEAIRIADRLYITEVDLSPEAPIRFPNIDPAIWREIRRERGVRGPRDDANFEFVDYERVEFF